MFAWNNNYWRYLKTTMRVSFLEENAHPFYMYFTLPATKIYLMYTFSLFVSTNEEIKISEYFQI